MGEPSLKGSFLSFAIGGAIGLGIMLSGLIPDHVEVSGVGELPVQDTFGYIEVPVIGEMSNLTMGVVVGSGILLYTGYAYVKIKFL